MDIIADFKVEEQQEIKADFSIEPNQSGGGGDIGTGDYNIKVIDYDGTIIAEKNLNSGLIYKLPDAPQHEGLVFQTWSCAQEIIDNKITVGKSDILIGAIYTTESGKNEFDIELTTPTGLSVTLNMDGNKDWGDGTTNTETTHIYSKTGKYTIKCDGTIMDTSGSSGLFGQNPGGNASTYANYNYYVVAIRLAYAEIGHSAFAKVLNAKYISLSNNITSLATSAITINANLRHFIIPPSITDLSQQSCISGNSIEYIVIPNGITAFGTNSVQSNRFLKMMFPKTVTVFNIYTLATNNNCMEYNFTLCQHIPNLTSYAGFLNINKLAKIKVPLELETQWKTKTNWVTYADYIEGV